MQLMKRLFGPMPAYFFPPPAVLVLFLAFISVFAYSLMVLQLQLLRYRRLVAFFYLWVIAGLVFGLFSGLTAAEFCLIYLPLILNIGLGCALVRLGLQHKQLRHQACGGEAAAGDGQGGGGLERQ